MIDKTLLREYAKGFGVALDGEALERFDLYAQRLAEKNRVMNLTAITEPDEVVVKHFVDSLSLLEYVRLPAGAEIVDVGTGAGFPGVPLLIARPDLRVALLDGTRKKLDFIKETLAEIGLSAQTVHLRAEEAGRKPEHRARYDLAASRAVAVLPTLLEYCLPLVKIGGAFVAMKSVRVDEECARAEAAIRLLGGEKPDVKSFSLPDGSERSLVVVRKISQTPTIYPRPSAKIACRPLG